MDKTTKSLDMKHVKYLVGWRAWYTDGNIYDSSSYKWTQLPTFGVQIVEKFYSPEENGPTVGREILKGADCYCPFNGIWDYKNTTKWVKWGEQIHSDDHRAMYDKVISIPKEDWPKFN